MKAGWCIGLVATFAISPALAGCCCPGFGGPASAPSGSTPAAPSSAPPAPAPPPPVASDIHVTSVVFARSLDDQWQPVGGPVTEFRADEHTVWARATIDGRPRSGTVTMRWMWRDLKIGEAQIDLSSVNGGLLFSFGQDTFIKGFMTTPQLYIGHGHRLLLLSGTTELGAYPFTVVPPEGARPSRYVTGNLYAHDPRQGGLGTPTNTFGPNDTVYVVVRAATGQASWLDATFTVNGQPNPALTQEHIGTPGGGDEENFVMTAHPEGGWPVGQHRVTMVLNDQDVATYDFTVHAAP